MNIKLGGVHLHYVCRNWHNEYVWRHYWWCCMYREHTPLQEGIGMKLQVMVKVTSFLILKMCQRA